jgi:hypothetical protein
MRLPLLLLAASLLACGEESMSNQESATSGIPASAWDSVASKKIFWGHQSVGFNILDGVEELMRDSPGATLTVVRSSDPRAFGTGALLHETVGGNLDPQSKLEDFVAAIDAGIGGTADYAFLKFCYLDFNAQTDSTAVFASYRDAMDRLSEAYPSTRILHITVPLTERQRGPKALVKRLLGKPLAGFEDNRRRHEYNELLKQTYAGRAPIFDLAAVESTFPDGSRETVDVGGTTVPALAPALTDDGGHLNEAGRRAVADKFIRFLAELD